MVWPRVGLSSQICSWTICATKCEASQTLLAEIIVTYLLLPKKDFKVLICGSGVNGLATAFRCQAAGIKYIILERDDGLGGTWHQNFYPGVRCDTPSITYSFSSDPNYNWKKYFADGAEVKEYVQRICDQRGISHNVRYNMTVESARWKESESLWEVSCVNSVTKQIEVFSANVFVSAVGQLSNPNIPKIPGQELFEGKACHTARYDSTIDFKGKNVVVMGTGATAMGICPEIQKQARHLTIFQGTPQWYVDIPNHKKQISEEEQWCMRYLPFYERWYRFYTLRHIVDYYTDVLTSNSDANRSLQDTLEKYISGQVNGDSALVAKMTPKHPPVCTRMLVDNHWCKMMLEPNVTLVDGRAASITANSVVGPHGEVADADIIIYATGFQSTKFCTASLQVFGKNGVSLADDWNPDPTAYLGMCRPSFPNFFMMYGPNTNVSSGGSIIWCAETAGRYIGQCITAMVRSDIYKMSVKEDVHDEYNRFITEELKWTAWNDNRCNSWYKNGKTGKVTNNLPMALEEWWNRTRLVNLDDFDVRKSRMSSRGGA